MQMIKIRTFLIFTFLLISCLALAQREVTTEEGEIIVLDEDGTWRSIDDRAGEPGDKKTIDGCDYRMLERDQFTEEDWIIMTAQPLVEYTRESKEDDVKWLPFTRIETYNLFTGGNVGAYFKFILQSAAVDEQLEGISKGNELKIFTPGNPPVTLEFEENAITRENYDEETTEYVTYVDFSDVQAQVLNQNPVEKIGVEWNGKYLEYPVSNPDLFQEQLNCIKARL